MDIFYYLWVCPEKTIGKHMVGWALSVSMEITNTSFKRLSLKKPNFLGQVRRKKKTQLTDHVPASWKVYWLREGNVLAGLVLETVTCATESGDFWRHISKRRLEEGGEGCQNPAESLCIWLEAPGLCSVRLQEGSFCWRCVQVFRMAESLQDALGRGVPLKFRQNWGLQSMPPHQGALCFSRRSGGCFL